MNTPLFQRQQLNFTAHLRNSKLHPKPTELEERRVKIYRDLLLNNIQSFLESSFPVLHSLYSNPAWQQLAEQFFANYKCHSPYFIDIPKAFLNYLQTSYQATSLDPPFLIELAHYEWAELELMSADEQPITMAYHPHGSLLKHAPLLSPLTRCYAYQWPVHTISANQFPTQPTGQAYFILIYRNAQDEVKFIELNAASAYLFEQLQKNNQTECFMTGEQVIEQLAAQLKHPQPELVLQGGLQTLTRWQQLGIILGVRE